MSGNFISWALAILLVLPASVVYSQEADLPQRVADLEKRVAELAAALRALTNSGGSSTHDSPAPKGKVLFEDGFETGLGKWTTDLAKGGKWAQGRGSDIADFSVWQAVKGVTYQQHNLQPSGGSRFATTSRQQDGMSVILPENQNWDEWYGYRYLLTKDTIDLSATKLPTLSLSVLFDHFTQGFRWNVVIVGYLVDGDGIADFQQLLRLDQPIPDWRKVEVDLSSVPKDKPVRLGIVYGCVNSHHGASSGVHVDDVILVDEGSK